MLKLTGQQLELIPDYDMLPMIKKGNEIIYVYKKKMWYNIYFFYIVIGIRGGLTQASMRYAKANNEKTPDYDPALSKSWLVYQDCKYNFTSNFALNLIYYLNYR